MTDTRGSDYDRVCRLAPNALHAVVPGGTRDHAKTGTCRHCGATVRRAHRRSAVWWHDWTNPDDTRPRDAVPA